MNYLTKLKHKNLIVSLLSILLSTFLVGCSSVKATDYVNNQPKLTADYFDGSMTAHGIVKNRSGKVIRYFNVDMLARRDGNGVITLEEDFLFDDGEEQRRIWTLTPTQDNNYKASANDVVGSADMNFSGNALFMNYVLNIPYKKRSIDINVDDRMYLINPDMLVNESVLTKWGFRVGSLSLVIIKSPQI